MNRTLILINPWIDDFAAYDLWAKPLGLLGLAGELRQARYEVALIDCLDVHHPSLGPKSGAPRIQRRRYGTGKYARREIPKPPVLKHTGRPFSRYGMSTAAFQEDLSLIRDPAAVLVTSLMTYWYPGVQATIAAAREVHPKVPVILGGIYARLCPDHANRHSGADHVFTRDDPATLAGLLASLGARPSSAPACPQPPPPYPTFDLLHGLDYVCLLTSRGCPYRCRYCASHLLSPGFSRRDPDAVLAEILFWNRRHGVQDFAFYDDALLVGPQAPLKRMLEGVAREAPGLRFHTPNALHVREITPETAGLMRRAGFTTIRLGLETTDFTPSRLDRKVREGDFERAVGSLMDAGFSGEEVGAYLLAGLPGQKAEAVQEALALVERAGVLPFISEYSPIPHTSLWREAIRTSPYDLAGEPLFHNNTLLPCWDVRERARLPELRQRVRAIREKVRTSRGHPEMESSEGV